MFALSTAESPRLSLVSFLRPQGHLKEQDALIEFVIELCKTHTLREAMEKLERRAEQI